MIKITENLISKYLKHWAEDFSDIDFSCFKKKYKSCLVVPLFREIENIRGQIENISRISSDRTLVIYVINQNSDSKAHYNENLETKNIIIKRGHAVKIREDVDLVTNNDFDMLVVDRFTKPFGEKDGVGLARKIGADLAVRLMLIGILDSNFFYSSDADVIFPDDYFKEEDQLGSVENKIAIIIKDFIHNTENLGSNFEKDALIDYSKYLKYFRDGLKFAKSCYAYHTIGSCLCISFEHYSKARGFPKKAAGEDFYLVNKLNKIGLVRDSKLQPLTIIGRISSRVPFGTGPSVSEISKRYMSGEPYLVYAPKAFLELKKILKYVDSVIEGHERIRISSKIEIFLKKVGFFDQLKRSVETCKGKPTAKKNFNDWFDGLRQLQLLNFVSQEMILKIPIDVAIEEMKRLTNDVR